MSDATGNRVETVVREGDGFAALHSARYARSFIRLIGESGDLGDVRWENPGEPDILTVESPDHPTADGVEVFALPQTEMLGEASTFGAP